MEKSEVGNRMLEVGSSTCWFLGVKIIEQDKRPGGHGRGEMSMMWWTARWKSLYGRWAFVVVGEVPLLGAAERCDWWKEGCF